MINTLVGDTIIFEAYLSDSGGTAITNAAGALTIVDASGSTVVSAGNAPHQGAGTYSKTQSTTGWGYGPIVENWKFTNSTGTISQIVGNKFNITGSLSLESYVWAHELFAWYENIENYFDGSEQERVFDAYQFINQQLNTLGYRLPVAKGTSGYYDQALRDWNAYESIYRLVSSRAVSQTRDNEEKPWFDYFKKMANEKWDQFAKKKIVLNSQTSPGEAGIQPGTKIAGTLFSTMETNWEGYGAGFKGADFPRTWRIEVISTGTAGGFSESMFRWSSDNGITWEGTMPSTNGWTLIKDEVYLRFGRGTGTTLTGIFSTGDVWQFNTAPLKISTGGKQSAQSY